MDARIRAARIAALWLAAVLSVSATAAEGLVPEWQQDLNYLTWDRRAEEPTAVGGPIYLQPGTEPTSAISNVTPASTWQLRVRDFYSVVTPRRLWSRLMRRDAQEETATQLAMPESAGATPQAVGPVARHDERGASRTVVR